MAALGIQDRRRLRNISTWECVYSVRVARVYSVDRALYIYKIWPRF